MRDSNVLAGIWHFRFPLLVGGLVVPIEFIVKFNWNFLRLSFIRVSMSCHISVSFLIRAS